MANVVNQGLKVKLLPDKDVISVLEQNIGNSRFIWNNILAQYKSLYKLFKSHNYPLNPNINNFNAILKILKEENSFLREGESTSQQQVFIDLNKAFTKFFKEDKGYPKFKSKKKSKTIIQNTKNRKQHQNNQ